MLHRIAGLFLHVVLRIGLAIHGLLAERQVPQQRRELGPRSGPGWSFDEDPPRTLVVETLGIDSCHGASELALPTHPTDVN